MKPRMASKWKETKERKNKLCPNLGWSPNVEKPNEQTI